VGEDRRSKETGGCPLTVRGEVHMNRGRVESQGNRRMSPYGYTNITIFLLKLRHIEQLIISTGYKP
jgi:hypothetical protein